MKALNLKGMSWIMALAMMFIVSFTSCSDDKEEGATTPVFPEEQAISCNAGETKVLTFDANMTWQLSSTAAIWCKFEVNGEDKEVVKGEAGKQSITIKVTDAAQEIGKTSEAQLKLDMGGETKVIATVTRSAKGYSLKIYDAEGNEITTEQGLEVGYKKQISFTVKANFRFAATSFPEWVILDGGSMAGEVNDKEEGELKIQATNGLTVKENGEYEKWPVEAGKDSKNVITFADEAGNASFSFPVFFKGMGAEDINITEPELNSRYGWNVSLDGKTFKLAGSTDGGENVITFNDKMEFTVVSLKDEYEVVLLDAFNHWETGKKVIEEMNSYSSWIKYTKNGNKVTLTVNELNPDSEGCDSRECYALVIPKAQYEQIKEDITGNLVTVNEEGEQDLVYAYGQNNLLINLVQEEEKAAIGKTAPYFRITNPKGKQINRSNFKDQYLLIHFWASWDTVSRDSNAVYRRIYKQERKNKKFALLGVSLDMNKDTWQKAIKADTLEWEQVCDFSGWNAEIVKQLAIKTLPANILLNPFGKIEGKDMTEEAIKKKLKEIENTEKEKQQNKSKR